MRTFDRKDKIIGVLGIGVIILGLMLAFAQTNRPDNDALFGPSKCMTQKEITAQLEEFNKGVAALQGTSTQYLFDTNPQTSQSDMAKELEALQKKFESQPDTQAIREQQAKELREFMEKRKIQ